MSLVAFLHAPLVVALFRPRLLHGVVLAMLAGAYAATPVAAAIDDPVESGREALDPDDAYPWYDADADEVRPLHGRADAKEVQGDSDPSGSKSEGGGRRSGDGDDDRGSFRFSSGGALAGAEIIAWIVVGAIVVAIVGMLLYAVLQSEGPKAKDRSGDGDADGVDLAALPVPVQAADSDLLAEARRWYDQGDFARAMIYLYSHLLLRLDKGQLIRLARGKTNRQYLREVGGRRSLADYFAQAIETFESAFFGRRQLARDEFEASWRGVDDFHRLIEEAHA